MLDFSCLREFCWSLCFCLSSVWFWTENLIFRLLNRFRPKSILPRITDPILLQSASKLALSIRKHEITSEAVVRAYIDRIRIVNPVINALVQENFEEALRQAKEVDEMLSFDTLGEKEHPLADKPFLGVPFTLKDAILVKDLVCTAGIHCRRNARSAADADCVQRMKAAGAICLGVTNVSEVCMWWESINGVYGRSRNPYDDRRIVGGSSGGEGALIGAAGSVFGLGSDIGGSLRMPAFFNGIYTHKPSKFVVSADGCIPAIHGFQKDMFSIGPMCRYFEDLKPMLQAMSLPQELGRLKLNEAVNIGKLRYFYMDSIKTPAMMKPDADTRRSMKKVIHYLQRRHDVLCHRLDLPLMHYAMHLWMNDMTQVEGVFEKAADANLNEARRQKICAMRARLARELQELLGTDGVLLMAPHPTCAPFHNQPLCQPFNYQYTAVFNCLGTPVTQVPLGLNADGIPTGIQIVAAGDMDRLTLAVGQELDHAFGGWRYPGASC